MDTLHISGVYLSHDIGHIQGTPNNHIVTATADSSSTTFTWTIVFCN